MSVLVARIGRDRQRYEDNFRLVSGCIPFKLIEDGGSCSCEMLHRLKVLMVSTPNRNDLVFPKGGWEDDETVEEAACREALEEAGVKGIIQDAALGVWEFRSKSREEKSCLEGGCRGYMFALEVTEELEVWPEQKDKSRIWLNVEEAQRLCRYDWMRKALDKFSELMTERLNYHERLNLHADDDGFTRQFTVSVNCRVNPSSSAHHSSPREFLGKQKISVK